MGKVNSVVWMRKDSAERLALEHRQSLSLREAVRMARRISQPSEFLFGQILGGDGRVLANFARGAIKFNR